MYIEPIDKRFFFYYNYIVKNSTISTRKKVTYESMKNNIVLYFYVFRKEYNNGNHYKR